MQFLLTANAKMHWLFLFNNLPRLKSSGFLEEGCQSFLDSRIMLSPEAIKEFKEIYKEENGKELSDAEALEMENNLLNLFRVLLKPLSEKEKEEFRKLKLCQQKKK